MKAISNNLPLLWALTLGVGIPWWIRSFIRVDWFFRVPMLITLFAGLALIAYVCWRRWRWLQKAKERQNGANSACVRSNIVTFRPPNSGGGEGRWY